MIDGQIKRPWPDEVNKALADIRQGDVIEAPPFFYAHGGDIRLWGIPAPEGDEEGEEGEGDEEDDFISQVDELHPDDGAPFGIITSQTCDVDEQGPKPTHVWFQVSPVYAVPDDPAEADRLLSKQYTVPLTGPDLPEGRWVADLRIELPIEKSWLVGVKRMRGFGNEDEAERFGVKIGRRRARPALANELVDNVTKLIRTRKQVRKPKELKALVREIWANDIYRVMLAIEGGTRLKPAAVRVHVICPAEPTERVQEWFSEWEDEARQQADDADIELHMTLFHDARTVDLHEYDRWVELDFN